jgi:hypothetical protein
LAIAVVLQKYCVQDKGRRRGEAARWWALRANASPEAWKK